MPKRKCYFCQIPKPRPPLNKWVKEEIYQGALRTKADYQKNYQGSNYYCSLGCHYQKQEKEIAELAKNEL